MPPTPPDSDIHGSMQASKVGAICSHARLLLGCLIICQARISLLILQWKRHHTFFHCSEARSLKNTQEI